MFFNPMQRFFKKYWREGDVFCGRGGGTVLWRVGRVTEFGTIEATCLLDGERRSFYPDQIVRRSGMKYSPYPMKAR